MMRGAKTKAMRLPLVSTHCAIGRCVPVVGLLLHFYFFLLFQLLQNKSLLINSAFSKELNLKYHTSSSTTTIINK